MEGNPPGRKKKATVRRPETPEICIWPHFMYFNFRPAILWLKNNPSGATHTKTHLIITHIKAKGAGKQAIKEQRPNKLLERFVCICYKPGPIPLPSSKQANTETQKRGGDWSKVRERGSSKQDTGGTGIARFVPVK